LYGYFYLRLIDDVSSKIVPLEKGTVVIYGANALSLLLIVVFILFINVHVRFFFSFCAHQSSFLCVYDMV